MSEASRLPRHRSLLRIATCVAISVPAAGCTGSSPASQSLSQTHSLASPVARPGSQAVELSCSDANLSAEAPTGRANHTVDGLTIEARLDSLTGSAPANVGLRVAPGSRLFFVKAPLYMKPGTPMTTIKLTSASGGYLAWVPSRSWTGGSGPIDLAPWVTRTVVLDGCTDRPSTYLGGMLSTDRHMCLRLQVSQGGGKATALRIGPSARCASDG